MSIRDSRRISDYAMVYALCGWNKFRWLSDSGYPQGYSRSRVKREALRSPTVVSTKVKVGSSFAG